MSFYFARQPIFDLDKSIIAYELLYRPDENPNNEITDNRKTEEVILNSILELRVDSCVRDKRMFVNFTKENIMSGLPELFDNKKLIIELLEDIVPDEKFLLKCRKYKEMGYVFALDDFVIDYPYTDLIELADILKVDFRLTDEIEREKITRKYCREDLTLLAEKIETIEEVNEAKKLGFQLFQGFFYAKPELRRRNQYSSIKSSYVKILNELQNPSPSFDKLDTLIRDDVTITLKLLKMVNSVAYYSSRVISSIREAMVKIGLNTLKRFFCLIVLDEIDRFGDKELFIISMSRAIFMEKIAKYTNMEIRSSEFFLLGLLSLIDIITRTDMEDIIIDLPLSYELKDTLLGKETPLQEIYKFVLAYEKGDWNYVDLNAERLSLNCEVISKDFVDSMTYSERLIQSDYIG